MKNIDEKKTAAVVLNGEMGNKEYYLKLFDSPEVDLIIAADGGADLFFDLKLNPDWVIGDLDSLSRKKIDKLKSRGTKVKSFPSEKDETDSELCLHFCHKRAINRVIMLSALGGRVDQFLANIFLLEYAESLGIEAKIREKKMEIGLIKNNINITNKNGWRLSLLPLDNRVKGVTIKGCKYEVSNLEMERHRTRGVSNKIVSSCAEISKKEGTLLYIISEKKHKN